MIRRDGLLDCLARAGRRHPSVGTWPDLRAVVAQTTYSDKGFVIAARCWQGLGRRASPRSRPRDGNRYPAMSAVRCQRSECAAASVSP